jgi:hypothetical protein
MHLAVSVKQAILKTSQPCYWHAAPQFLCCAGEFQTIDDSLSGHKRRMIVFLRHAVKAKARKIEPAQILRLIGSGRRPEVFTIARLT